jgi:hypothetical protein
LRRESDTWMVGEFQSVLWTLRIGVNIVLAGGY